MVQTARRETLRSRLSGDSPHIEARPIAVDFRYLPLLLSGALRVAIPTMTAICAALTPAVRRSDPPFLVNIVRPFFSGYNLIQRVHVVSIIAMINKVPSSTALIPSNVYP